MQVRITFTYLVMKKIRSNRLRFSSFFLVLDRYYLNNNRVCFIPFYDVNYFN